MTTEEKAKAYDEALERARQIKDGKEEWRYSDLAEITPALTEIFPQLCESEDERIRKHLVEIVEIYWGTTNDPDKAKDLAYLEKRKEQKPVMIQWTGKNLKEVIDFTGKSPKFGEWFKSWEDFENYVHSHDDILKLFCEDGSHYEVPVGAWIVKTPDGYNTPSRFRFIQKPAEWNFPYGVNETVDKLIAIAECLEMDGDCLFNDYKGKDCGKFLRELARRESENKHAEWSERDKKVLVAISKALGCDTAEKILVNEGVTLMMAAGFLESLRPSWKPSEACYGAKGDPDPAGVWAPTKEQMALLQAVIVEPSNAGAESCHLALKAIYVGLEELLSKYERSDR